MAQLRFRIIFKTILKMVTHDWPSGITVFGNQDLLLRLKPHFYNDIMNGQLGNPATMDLLRVNLNILYLFFLGTSTKTLVFSSFARKI